MELAERLTGLEDVGLIDEDGSPTPRRQIAMWNPPLTDAALGARRSALGEAAELLARLVREGARAICFMKSRKGVELLSRLVREELEAEDSALAELVVPYRAGYTPQQRRELEGRLVRGELRAVITTDALELGIDIGELDAAVVVTFPGTVASLRQMWGRAGRRGRGLAVYVAGEDALDQFFCRHPDEFLERPVEAAILDHESPQIHLAHLLCAAFEGPLSSDDAGVLGPRWEAYAEMLVAGGRLRRRSGTHPPAYVPRNPGEYPAAAVSLRSASLDSFAIVDTSSGELLGTTEAARAHSTVHQGADLPAPRALLRGAGARPGAPPRARDPVRRRLVHPAQARDRHHDREHARPPRDARGHALASARSPSPRPCSPTSAAASQTTRRSTSSRSTCPRRASPRRRSGSSSTPTCSTPSTPSARCTPPSTPRSRCCR